MIKHQLLIVIAIGTSDKTELTFTYDIFSDAVEIHVQQGVRSDQDNERLESNPWARCSGFNVIMTS